MTYNKSVEKVIIENAQIEKAEFKKAGAGNKFQIKFITKTTPKQPSLRELVEQLVVDMADMKRKFEQLKIDNNLK